MDLSLVPIALVLLAPLAFLVHRHLSARRRATLLKEKGIGRGAAGFQTNVRRIQVPPEIAARIRRGEQVSAEEITAAQERMQQQQEGKEAATGTATDVKTKASKVDDDWLPANARPSPKRVESGQGKRRKR